MRRMRIDSATTLVPCATISEGFSYRFAFPIHSRLGNALTETSPQPT